MNQPAPMNQPADGASRCARGFAKPRWHGGPAPLSLLVRAADLKNADAALSPNRRSAKMESGARVRLEGRRSALPGW